MLLTICLSSCARYFATLESCRNFNYFFSIHFRFSHAREMTEMSLAPPKQIRLMPSLNPIPVTLFLCSPPSQRCLPALAAPLAPLAASLIGRWPARCLPVLPSPTPSPSPAFLTHSVAVSNTGCHEGSKPRSMHGRRQFCPPLHSTLPLPVSTGQTGRRHR